MTELSSNYFLTLRKTDLENLSVIFELLRLFVETLTADDTYSLARTNSNALI